MIVKNIHPLQQDVVISDITGQKSQLAYHETVDLVETDEVVASYVNGGIKALIAGGFLEREAAAINLADGVDVEDIENIASNASAHASATTGVHGVGVSTVESAAGSASKVSAHAALTTGVHGVGASTIAKLTDIASDSNLSAAAQAAISAAHDGSLQAPKAAFASGVVTISAVGGVSAGITLTGWSTTYKAVATLVSAPATGSTLLVTQASDSFTISLVDSAGVAVDCSVTNAIVNWIAIKDTI